MRRQLEGVKRVKKKLADGSIVEYIYDRKTGVRLEGTPGTPEFAANRISAKNETFLRLSPKNNFAALIRQFERSQHFKDLGDRTKRGYTRRLKIIEDKWGSVPEAALTDIEWKRDFLAWRRELADTGHLREADSIVSVARVVLKWSVDEAIISHNVLAGLGDLYYSDRSDIIWLEDHINAFEAVCHPRSNEYKKQLLHRAVFLALHTGQREGDLLALRRDQYDGSYIRLTQSKSKRKGIHAKGKKPTKVEIPVTPALKSYIDSLPNDSDLFIPSPWGRPWHELTFQEAFREVRAEAGLDKAILPWRDEPVSLHFHDLRGTAVTLLAEMDCNVGQIAAITGHSLETASKILKRYMHLTRQMADKAMEKFAQHPRIKNSSRTSRV